MPYLGVTATRPLGGEAGRHALAWSAEAGVGFVLTNYAPVRGRFIDAGGTPLTDEIILTPDETYYTGWATVAAGGGLFLVSYIEANQTSNPLYARFLHYGTTPAVSARHHIADVWTEWPHAEKARPVWYQRGFLIGTRVPDAASAGPQVQLCRLDLTGRVTAPVRVTDGVDYYGSPALAVTPNGGIGLAIGFRAGLPAYTGGAYLRRFDADTLAPFGDLVPLVDAGRTEDHSLVYEPVRGRFVAAWYRADRVETRVIQASGEMEPIQTALEPGGGPVLATTGAETVLVAKAAHARLVALRAGAPTTLTEWDGRVPDYLPSVTPTTPGRWLVTWQTAQGGSLAALEETEVRPVDPPEPLQPVVSPPATPAPVVSPIPPPIDLSPILQRIDDLAWRVEHLSVELGHAHQKLDALQIGVHRQPPKYVGRNRFLGTITLEPTDP